VNAEAQCLFRSEHTSVLPEDTPRAGGAVSRRSSRGHAR
jgi:hypothetical protein